MGWFDSDIVRIETFETFRQRINFIWKKHIRERRSSCLCFTFWKTAEYNTTNFTIKNAQPIWKPLYHGFFLRREFQHRGRSHWHILANTANVPEEELLQDMPETIKMIDDLCSTHSDDPQILKNQTHKHTFTCYKNNKTKCRFNYPVWLMK